MEKKNDMIMVEINGLYRFLIKNNFKEKELVDEKMEKEDLILDAK
jgi:hypothetical protein